MNRGKNYSGIPTPHGLPPTLTLTHPRGPLEAPVGALDLTAAIGRSGHAWDTSPPHECCVSLDINAGIAACLALLGKKRVA